MSASGNPSSGYPTSPEAVLNELQRQAERKASLKMFYSAADMFRDYHGPFASETARERERLASEYQQLGRAAEEARWGTGTGAAPAMPPRPVARPTPPAAPPPPRRTPPPAAKPKVDTTPAKPVRKPEVPRKPDPQVRVEGGQIMFPCRWCKETLSFDVSNAGKLLPCPKCDLLVSVPKPAS